MHNYLRSCVYDILYLFVINSFFHLHYLLLLYVKVSAVIYVFSWTKITCIKLQSCPILLPHLFLFVF